VSRIDPPIISTLQTSSVRLMRLDGNGVPRGGGSGCLLDCRGTKFLLTVSHLSDKGQLSLALRWDPDKRQNQVRYLKDFRTIAVAKFDPGSEFKDFTSKEMDFGYQKFPFDDEPLFQELDPNGSGKVLSSRPCTIWKEDAIQAPNTEDFYGFAGHTKTQLFRPPGKPADVTYVAGEFRICYPFKFIREELGLYLFAAPIPHPGHEYFAGCSGAPIVDMQGHVVALVSGGFGNENVTVIVAFPLEPYKALFHSELSKLIDQAMDE
jgi:hypothetical protein